MTHDAGLRQDGPQKAEPRFRCTINVGSAGTLLGCIWEMGGSGRGSYLGFDGTGDLIFRGGDDTNVNDRARLVVANASIPTDQTSC